MPRIGFYSIGSIFPAIVSDQIDEQLIRLYNWEESLETVATYANRRRTAIARKGGLCNVDNYHGRGNSC